MSEEISPNCERGHRAVSCHRFFPRPERRGQRLIASVGLSGPVAQIREIKARDPQCQKVAELYELWWEHHGDAPTKASELRANPLRTTPLRRPFYLRFDLPDAAAAAPSSVMNSRRLIRSPRRRAA